MNSENETLVYHSLNIPIDKLREYNVEKYHFLSCILDILILHLHVEKDFLLTSDDIYRHFQMQNLNFEKEKEKYNAALVQLLGAGEIIMDKNGIISITEKGISAYHNQIYHNIAANLYAAERSNHLSKVAIIAASVLSVISIVCTLITIIIR